MSARAILASLAAAAIFLMGRRSARFIIVDMGDVQILEGDDDGEEDDRVRMFDSIHDYLSAVRALPETEGDRR